MKNTEYIGIYYYVKWNENVQPNSRFNTLEECEKYIEKSSLFGKNGYSIHCSKKSKPIKEY